MLVYGLHFQGIPVKEKRIKGLKLMSMSKGNKNLKDFSTLPWLDPKSGPPKPQAWPYWDRDPLVVNKWLRITNPIVNTYLKSLLTNTKTL